MKHGVTHHLSRHHVQMLVLFVKVEVFVHRLVRLHRHCLVNVRLRLRLQGNLESQKNALQSVFLFFQTRCSLLHVRVTFIRRLPSSATYEWKQKELCFLRQFSFFCRVSFVWYLSYYYRVRNSTFCWICAFSVLHRSCPLDTVSQTFIGRWGKTEATELHSSVTDYVKTLKEFILRFVTANWSFQIKYHLNANSVYESPLAKQLAICICYKLRRKSNCINGPQNTN